MYVFSVHVSFVLRSSANTHDDCMRKKERERQRGCGQQTKPTLVDNNNNNEKIIKIKHTVPSIVNSNSAIPTQVDWTTET